MPTATFRIEAKLLKRLVTVTKHVIDGDVSVTVRTMKDETLKVP